ncbi:MAG TPA: deoxyribonuclease V [Blastocatellia bacterium]|jgi:deoxyribonuclease V|nr:deoxyribonuclease V [Blastocatellia bacterium]
MEYKRLHAWDLTPTEAVQLQKKLREQVRVEPLKRDARLVAGCDISFNKFSEVVYAGIVVLRLPGLEIVDRATAITRTTFPYIPGLLSFRETPALLEAWEKLTTAPDVVMLDGQGLAHPRRFGIACHFGLITGRPTLGCAKTVLVGRYDEPGESAGSYSLMVDKGETVGAAVRTKDRVAPVYISLGNLIDLPGAIDLALRCVKGYAGQGESLFDSKPASKSKYRIPEPTRQAHLLVNELRRAETAREET